MIGSFSLPPLEKLLQIEADLELAAVITPVPSAGTEPLPRRLESPAPVASDLPIIQPYLEPNIRHLAWSHQIPVWDVGPLAHEPTLDLLATLRPDLIVVACFPYIFPAALLALPPYGCLNLHPSPLPAYRGPAPLFWMARHGAQQAGVTLHFLDEGLDTGDIVAQTSLAWPEDLPGSELEHRCAVEGAALLAQALVDLDSGKALPRQAQPEANSSYFPWPSEQDLIIPTRWDARRAFKFARGADGWPLVIEPGAERFPIRIAVDYDLKRSLAGSHLLKEDELWVQFEPGVLHVMI